MLDHYQRTFTHQDVRFSQQEELILIYVENPMASAVITTYGGQVLSYQPQGDTPTRQEMLWVSPDAIFNGSKPVRGGIPVCWPWFGVSGQEGLPAHGFVRNRLWQVDAIESLADGGTEIILTCHHDKDTLALWPHEFELRLHIHVGQTLKLSLVTKNLSDAPMTLTEAFHTYFSVVDCQNTLIHGLDQTLHCDKLTHVPPQAQQGDVTLNPPMDSVFLNQSGPIHFMDEAHFRSIRIEHSGQSAVVWNPGPEGVNAFSDIPNQVWPSFMCVETGHVLDNAITVLPGKTHRFETELSLEKRVPQRSA